MDFANSFSSSNPILEEYTIVTVIGGMFLPDLFNPLLFEREQKANWKDWDYFLHFQNSAVSVLSGHNSDGSELPAWRRCAIYKSKNTLFVYYGNLFDSFLSVY